MSVNQMHTLRVGRHESGYGHRAELDGQDISNAILGLTVTFKGGESPTANLDVILDEIPTEADDVRVYLPQETRDLLVRLGWTPPAEEATP